MTFEPRTWVRLLALTLLACDGPEPEAAGAEGAAEDPEGAFGDCEVEVQIGLYGSDECAGEPRMVQTMRLADGCSAWNHGSRANSATRFQCWRDRLCFTQYVESGACEPEDARLVTDKQAWTRCEKDDTPNVYTKILGGTEDCPEPPAGFACPISAPGEGTPGIAAACEG